MSGLRRMFACVPALLCCVSLCARALNEPALSAASAILVDAGSGRALYAQNAHEARPIASITKLMTALVAAESFEDLDATVTIVPEWTGVEGTSLYLSAGEELTFEALLYGLLLESGNDAALALACFCAGDEETFQSWMNLRAQSLGMEQTHFSSPSGLSDTDNYSTAADMAKLAAACMGNETIAKIVGTKSASFGTRTFTNHNKLLWRYEGCVGMKTGFTTLAGRTLVTCAQRGEQRLIAVTLNDPNDWEDHAALFEYGFSQWPAIQLCRAGKQVARLPVNGSLVRFVPVYARDNVAYPLCLTENVRAEILLPETAQAPVTRGAIAGKITFFLADEPVGESYLLYGASVASNAVMRHPLIRRLLNCLQEGQRNALPCVLALAADGQSGAEQMNY